MRDQLLGGRYRLVRQLGEGGMGQVWEAQDEVLGRPVAIKVVSLLAGGGSHGDEARARFLREAQITARLQHANIVTIHDLGETGTEDDKAPFLVMELVRGEGLDAKLRRGAVALPDAARWGAQIGDALADAHNAGIMHRDIKPSNILITPSGIVKVLDFGIARAADPYATADRLTRTGFIVGTPPYMAPEQARGLPEPRSDLYALGCLLFELITGRLPFQAPDTVGYLTAHLTQEPPAPSSVAQGIPPAWDNLVLTLLHKDPAQRYPNAADLAQALRQLDCAPEPASPPDESTTASAAGKQAASQRVRPIPARVLKNDPAHGAAVGLPALSDPDGTTQVTVTRWHKNPGDALIKGDPLVDVSAAEIDTVITAPLGGVLELTHYHAGEHVPTGYQIAVIGTAGVTQPDQHGKRGGIPATAMPPDPVPPPQVPASLVEAAANPTASAATFAPPGARRWRPSRRAVLLAGVGAVGIAAVPVGMELESGKQPPKPLVISSSAAQILHADLGGAVASVAFSPDGKTLASATGNGRIWLWSVATRKPVATLTLIPDAHGSVPDTTAVAFSPNGKILAGNVDLIGSKNTWLWDVATRKVMTTFTSNNVIGQTLAAVAFSPDSKTLASGNTSATSGDRMVSLWDVATHKRIADIDAVAWSVAFSPDGTTLAVGTDSGNVELVDLATQNGTETLDAGDAVWVRSVAFSPGGSTLACSVVDPKADSPGAVQLWNLATQTKTASLSTNQCETVAFSPDGRLIASCSTKSGLVQLWNPATRTNTTTLDTSTAQVTSVAFSPDGRLLASGGTRLMLWKLDTPPRRKDG
ncbi:protein kinase [Streptomyces violascens]|uniref:protein kinase domain-containing protein n=1 Tax=Streptomyces violascens TaxID=67381 RepID=UPI003799C13B